ncbi:hypothetical protein GF340_04095, partial [Candidatus Peregrinibacteria bacterium]|nr:hypothetical protein [Candidatus Peregrinibacteria bacterium]
MEGIQKQIDSAQKRVEQLKQEQSPQQLRKKVAQYEQTLIHELDAGQQELKALSDDPEISDLQAQNFLKSSATALAGTIAQIANQGHDILSKYKKDEKAKLDFGSIDTLKGTLKGQLDKQRAEIIKYRQLKEAAQDYQGIISEEQQYKSSGEEHDFDSLIQTYQDFQEKTVQAKNKIPGKMLSTESETIRTEMQQGMEDAARDYQEKVEHFKSEKKIFENHKKNLEEKNKQVANFKQVVDQYSKNPSDALKQQAEVLYDQLDSEAISNEIFGEDLSAHDQAGEEVSAIYSKLKAEVFNPFRDAVEPIREAFTEKQTELARETFKKIEEDLKKLKAEIEKFGPTDSLYTMNYPDVKKEESEQIKQKEDALLKALIATKNSINEINGQVHADTKKVIEFDVESNLAFADKEITNIENYRAVRATKDKLKKQGLDGYAFFEKDEEGRFKMTAGYKLASLRPDDPERRALLDRIADDPVELEKYKKQIKAELDKKNSETWASWAANIGTPSPHGHQYNPQQTKNLENYLSDKAELKKLKELNKEELSRLEFDIKNYRNFKNKRILVQQAMREANADVKKQTKKVEVKMISEMGDAQREKMQEKFGASSEKYFQAMDALKTRDTKKARSLFNEYTNLAAGFNQEERDTQEALIAQAYEMIGVIDMSQPFYQAQEALQKNDRNPRQAIRLYNSYLKSVEGLPAEQKEMHEAQIENAKEALQRINLQQANLVDEILEDVKKIKRVEQREVGRLDLTISEGKEFDHLEAKINALRSRIVNGKEVIDFDKEYEKIMNEARDIVAKNKISKEKSAAEEMDKLFKAMQSDDNEVRKKALVNFAKKARGRRGYGLAKKYLDYALAEDYKEAAEKYKNRITRAEVMKRLRNSGKAMEWIRTNAAAQYNEMKKEGNAAGIRLQDVEAKLLEKKVKDLHKQALRDLMITEGQAGGLRMMEKSETWTDRKIAGLARIASAAKGGRENPLVLYHDYFKEGEGSYFDSIDPTTWNAEDWDSFQDEVAKLAFETGMSLGLGAGASA